MKSRPIEPAALGLAPERLHLSRLGPSNIVIDTLQNARAPSTHSLYGGFLVCVTEMQAFAIAKASLSFTKARTKVTLCTNLAFLPKMILAFLVNQSVELEAFHPPPFQSDRERQLHTLCPLRALVYYVDRAKSWRQSEQSSVCYGSKSHGQALSKQRLSKWIADTVRTAYELANLPPPEKLTAHSTRGIATLWTLFQGASVKDICNAVVWATPHTFTRFYRLNVVDPQNPDFVFSVDHYTQA
ncbi:UNVERIFIED_CONTAM: hypothetical protein FKN15_032321 [Acipenser sinensis]